MKKTADMLLRRKFDLATFNDGESVEDFTLRLNGMAAELSILGAGVEEEKIMEKIARSVPPRFKQIVLSITTLLDLSTLSVSDMVGRLRVAEDAFEEAPGSLNKVVDSTSRRKSGMPDARRKSSTTLAAVPVEDHGAMVEGIVAVVMVAVVAEEGAH
jgi:hypothetical protein